MSVCLWTQLLLFIRNMVAVGATDARFGCKVGQIGKKWDKPVFFRYNFILTSTTSTAWETGDRRHFGMGVRFEPKVGHIGPKKDKPEKFYIIF